MARLHYTFGVRFSVPDVKITEVIEENTVPLDASDLEGDRFLFMMDGFCGLADSFAANWLRGYYRDNPGALYQAQVAARAAGRRFIDGVPDPGTCREYSYTFQPKNCPETFEFFLVDHTVPTSQAANQAANQPQTNQLTSA